MSSDPKELVNELIKNLDALKQTDWRAHRDILQKLSETMTDLSFDIEKLKQLTEAGKQPESPQV